MKYLKYLFLVLLLFCPADFIYADDGNALKTAVTTADIGAIVKNIAGDKIELITVVPGGMCPGHFDIDPGTVRKITDARLLIIHGWETWPDSFINKAGLKNAAIKKVELKSSWMVPDNNIKAVRLITDILCEYDGRNKELYQTNAMNYIEQVEKASVSVKKKMGAYKGPKVVASEQQKEFLTWLGFEVIRAYGRTEDMSIKEMADIISCAKKEKAKLVIDNLQSGPDTGVEIARELGIKHVTISNFPLRDSYIDTLDENINTIIKALDE